jgi:hypothetical protein
MKDQRQKQKVIKDIFMLSNAQDIKNKRVSPTGLVGGFGGK